METIVSKVQSLGDLELAILLSLVAEQHCIITTKRRLVGELAQELQIVCAPPSYMTSPETPPDVS